MEIFRNLNGWSWSLGGNIGFNKSKIGDLGFAPTDFGTLKNVRGYQGASIGDYFGIANLLFAGEAPALFFGYKTQSIIQPQDILHGKVAYTAADYLTKYYSSFVANDLGAGNIKAVDMNEDGVVDEKDKTIFKAIRIRTLLMVSKLVLPGKTCLSRLLLMVCMVIRY